MKKQITIPFILFLVFISSSITAQEQEWATVGAKWYYDHYSGIGNYLTVIESVKDTLVEGQSVKILESIHIQERYTSYDESHWDTIPMGRNLVYYQNDTIFHFRDGEFYPLYDFNVEPNDTVIVWEGMDCEDMEAPECYHFEYKVDSVGTLLLDNKEFKLIYNTPIQEYVWSFTNFSHPKPIIEKIGSQFYFFGTLGVSSMEGPVKSLRCYVDDHLTYKAEYWDRECDYIRPLSTPSTVEDITDNPEIKVFPNPSNGSFILEANRLHIQKIEMFDSKGSMVLSNDNIPSQMEINLNGFKNGIYHLLIHARSGVFSKKIIVE